MLQNPLDAEVALNCKCQSIYAIYVLYLLSDPVWLRLDPEKLGGVCHVFCGAMEKTQEHGLRAHDRMHHIKIVF